MFVNTQMPAINLAFPDVCNTPTPVGPIPIPYPNIGVSGTAIPNIFNQFTVAMPDHNLMTMVPMTNGDNVGVAMGLASGMVMGPCRHILGSFKVFKQVMPTTKMLCITGQNGMSPNMVGLTLSPSQCKVLVLT